MRSFALKIALFLALMLGLVFWHNASVSRGAISAPATGVAAILRPFQRGLLAFGDWASDIGRVMIRRQDIASENETLKLRLADAEGQNQRLLRYRRENDELRRLLKMAPPNAGKPIAAEIIAFDATDFTQRVTLNVGSRQGVKPKDVVYSAYGLVGQVVEAGPISSVVILLSDRDSGVGAMTTRTLAKGVVLGTSERICKLSYLDFGADVREGDLVVTSGLVEKTGAIFPKGMVIGRVLKVEKDKTYGRMDAYIDPAVPFDRITAVYVRVGA